MYEQEALKKNMYEKDMKKMQMKYGGNLNAYTTFVLGGNIGDPPKKLNKADYDAEVAKRQQSYEDNYANYLKSNYSIDKINDPTFQKQQRQVFEKTNPLDLSDIELDVTTNTPVTAHANSMGMELKPGFDRFGFDYNDKTWNPTSAAVSKYKALQTDEERNNFVFGYFGKGKGGEYKESTHSEAVKLGNVRPVKYADFQDIPQLGDDINKTFIPNQFEMMDQIDKATLPQKRFGGNIYNMGGNFDGEDDPRLRQGNMYNGQQNVPTNNINYINQGIKQDTPQYKTNPNDYNFQYNPNNTQENMKFNKEGQHWTNDSKFTYTPENVQQALSNNGFTPEQITTFMRQPGYMDQFFTYLNSQPNSDFAKSQFKDDDRFGPEHMLATLNNKSRIPGEPINFVPSLGPPNFNSGNPKININTLNPNSSQFIPPNIGNPNIGGEMNPPGNLKPFQPDWIASGVSMLPNIGMGVGNLSLANNLNFQRTNAEIMQPDYVDPTRAIQESRNQYAGAKDTIRQNAGGSGSLMSNLIGATASQSESQAGIESKYDEANANIYNQTEQFNTQNRQRARDMNSQIQMQEMIKKTELKQEGYQNLSNGLNTGINTDRLEISGNLRKCGWH